MTIRAWNTLVTQKVEVKNTQRLINDCYKTVNDCRTPKTKTAHILEEIESPTFSRKVQNKLLTCTRHETKTIIIARFKMLECGSNFKGTMNAICRTCKVTDNESHRLKVCPTNRPNKTLPFGPHTDFNNIYSNNKNVLTNIIRLIKLQWNTKTAHGSTKMYIIYCNFISTCFHVLPFSHLYALTLCVIMMNA